MPSLVLAALTAAAVGVFIVLAYRRRWQWTGLPAVLGPGNSAVEARPKTLWDWLQLLGIPVALASLAFLLNDAQTQRDQRREDQRSAQQGAIAADAERENSLRAYLAQMSALMLDRRLLHSKSGADVREVARTATLTAVRRLDGPRRVLVLQFLVEAKLIRRLKHGARLRLASADFAHVQLVGVNLSREDLSAAILRSADLSEADLSYAKLTRANLSGANLSGANLRGADLGAADLGAADLSRADLRGADLRRAYLNGADFTRAHLSQANLRGADIIGAMGAHIPDRNGSVIEATGPPVSSGPG